MKKFLLLIVASLTSISGAWAESFCFLTTQTQVTSITSGKYYVIDGRDQVGSTAHFLFDNGTKVTSNNPQALPTDPAEAGKFVWKIVGNSTDGWTLQNLATGKYMSLGGSNGSQISSSDTPQTNGIYFGDGDYATILNSNGQAIDIGGYGDNPTTWSGTTTPSGSRRLVIYEVDPVVITDGACYTMTFQAKTSGNTWGLRAGTSGATPDASGAGDVFVAHSYTNASGNRRWIFVKNSGTDAGAYLAYSGSAKATFDMSNAINEWDIAKLTAGSGYVNADANVAGKLCITNDKRYANNSSKGCYIVKEEDGTYAASDGPYLNGAYTSALVFTATGDAVSSAASLAIAKFEALYEVKNYLTYAGNISALFADPTSIEANINAAATAEAAAAVATNFMKSPEGKKFYAKTSDNKYLNIGPSVLSATSTTLTPDDVMEVVYAGNSKYYLKGIFRDVYVCTPYGTANISTTSTQGSAEVFYIGNKDNTTDNKVYFSNKTTSGNYGAIHYSSGYVNAIIGYAYTSDNSQWNLTAISDAEYTELCNTTCDVTYNAILEASGTVKATATTLNATRGATLSAPVAVARDYCTMTYYSDATCTEAIATIPNSASATVYVLVTNYNPPFTLSDSYENATWYYAKLRGTKYVRADESAKDGSGRYTTNTTNEKTDVYKWAFVGTNPYDLTIMNRGAGSSKYLYAESTSLPTMKAGVTPASDNKARWIATPNTQGAFAFRNESGATLYINDSGNNGNLGFWNSTYGTSDAGSNWVITEVPTVDVTYNLSVGGETVNTIVVNDVPEYSAVAVPASLTTGYTTFAYDFANSGTIGGENSIITVTGTLKSGLVKVSDLSNTKKYKITSARGSLSTYTDKGTTYLASPCKTSLGIEGKEFAILQHANHYYLYSVDDEKFVTYQSDKIAPLAENVTGTSDAISFQEITNAVYAIKFDNDVNKFLNSSASYDYGIIINDYGRYSGEFDDGNQYVLEEIGDFDSEDALASLTTYFGSIQYANIIAELKAVNWSDVGNAGQLNRYNFIASGFDLYAGNELEFLTDYEDRGYSAERLSYLQSLNIKGIGYALNLPATGKFYRIKGYSNNYITSNTAASNASMNGTASANNIVYYSADQNLIFFGSGYGLYCTHTVAPVGSTLNAYTFSEGAQSSHYYLKSNAHDYDASHGEYCYDNTANGTKLDRNGSPVTSGSYQTDWTLEEVTELPVTISSVGFATLNSPVALTIPTGVKAYTGELTGETGNKTLSLTEVDGTTIPANTPVVLEGSAGDYNFAVTTADAFSGTNDLSGTIAKQAKPEGNVYVLSKPDGEDVGFYKYTGTNIPGFRAYLVSATALSNGFTFSFPDDDVTAVQSVVDSQKVVNAQVYDLQGRKVANPVKGQIYIQNGKKVLY